MIRFLSFTGLILWIGLSTLTAKARDPWYRQVAPDSHLLALDRSSDKCFVESVYAYPPPYYDKQGRYWPGLVVHSLNHATTYMPQHPMLDGVTMILYWSILEPSMGHYDFRVIDEAVHYWKPRGKKLVLVVAPYGLPVQFENDLGGQQQGAMPLWLIKAGCKTLPPLPMSDALVPHFVKKRKSFIVPFVNDPVFRKHYQHLIQTLGTRYDSESTIARVHVGTGSLGEELWPFLVNRFFKAKQLNKAREGGWDAAAWYDYMRWACLEYRKAFPNHPLTLSLSSTGWFYGHPDIQKHYLADRFLHFVLIQNIAIGYNGWCGNTVDHVLSPRQTFPSLIPWLLAQFSTDGFPVELEPLRNLKHPLSDPVRMRQSLMLIRPHQINFFGDFIGVVNALEKRGDPKTYQASWDIYQKSLEHTQTDPQIKAHQVQQLFQTILEHRLPSSSGK